MSPSTSTLRNSLGGTRYAILPPLDPLKGTAPPEDGAATGSLPESMSSKHSSIERVCAVYHDEGDVQGRGGVLMGGGVMIASVSIYH